MNKKIFIILTFLGFFVFGGLLGTFFQQDEWAIFGNYIYWDKAALNWFTRLFVYEQETHLIPLSNLFSYLQFKAFGLNFAPYALLSILVHVVNAYLVYLLAQRFIGNKKTAFLAGLLFLVNASTHQAVTWTATTIGTAGSTLVALGSIIFFHRHIESEKNISVSLLFSICLLLVSLMFKETSIFLFAFYPMFWLISTEKRKIRPLVTLLVILGAVGLAYVGLRLLVSVFWTQTAATAEELSQPGLLVYVYRLITNPLRLVVQSIIPVPILLSLARILVVLAYPKFVIGDVPEPHIVDTIAVDIVSFIAATLFIVSGAWVYFFLRRRKLLGISKMLLVTVLYVVASSFPFLIIPGRAGYITLFDGRHLYLTSVFVSMASALLVHFLYQKVQKRKYLARVIIVLTLTYLGYHAITIQKDISSQRAAASVRRSILSTFTAAYPTLPSIPVFYVESDKAYYGLPPEEKVVPFQSGFGQTLLVWYNARGQVFPACLFERKYLYPLLSEGYKLCEGGGFGYYRHFNELASVVKEFEIGRERIIAFRFTSSNNVLRDISIEVHQRLRSK